MIELPTLYSHQAEHKDRLRSALGKHGRVILQASPGVGKTRMAKWILGAGLNKTPNENQSGHSLFAVHRRGLVDNANASFTEDPELPHGLIMSGRETTLGRRLQVASIDTLLSWFCEGGVWRNDLTFDLIVFDEAHSHFSKLATLLKAHDAKRAAMGAKPAYVIGLTATPQCKGLADVFRSIVSGPSTEWLIEHGFLSPFTYMGVTQGQLNKLVMRGGEFTKDSVCEAMDGLAGDLVRDWTEHASGRPTVGFFPRLSHAKQAQELLTAAGIEAGYVDGSTPDDERRAMFRALNNGILQYICNVGVVERGTDIPRIACVQLCVAIGSVVRYLQMIGRGSRVHPSKQDCLVLDHGGNIARHQFFEDHRDWVLDTTSKEAQDAGTRPTIKCPRCPAIYRGGKCRNCGYEPTPKERRAEGLVFDGTELKPIVRKDRKEPKKKTCEELMTSALYRAAMSGRTYRQAIGIAKGMAEKQGTKLRVPSTLTVAGRTIKMVPFGHEDGSRRVSALFDGFFARSRQPAERVRETAGSDAEQRAFF